MKLSSADLFSYRVKDKLIQACFFKFSHTRSFSVQAFRKSDSELPAIILHNWWLRKRYIIPLT